MSVALNSIEVDKLLLELFQLSVGDVGGLSCR